MAGIGIGKMAHDIPPGHCTRTASWSLSHALHFLKSAGIYEAGQNAVGKNAYSRQGYLAQDAGSGRDYHENRKGCFL
jgi:hypothetical protein